MQDKEYCFKIVFPNSATEVIFSAISQNEKNDWVQVLKEVQVAPTAIFSVPSNRII